DKCRYTEAFESRTLLYCECLPGFELTTVGQAFNLKRQRTTPVQALLIEGEA
uniref:Uncharacterized protein n=1 Tax=Aegilops tauschii subsp. strangulata TaxID=200361 RepID=A0A453KF43_AEGTS